MKLQKLNEILSKHNSGTVFAMDEFDEALSGYSPSDIMLKLAHGDFRSTDEYFEFDGYGNLKSFHSFEDVLDIYEDECKEEEDEIECEDCEHVFFGNECEDCPECQSDNTYTK